MHEKLGSDSRSVICHAGALRNADVVEKITPPHVGYSHPLQPDNMPGMRFHPLKGGRFSVWVDENYRVTFKFENGHACEVDYEDYH